MKVDTARCPPVVEALTRQAFAAALPVPVSTGLTRSAIESARVNGREATDRGGEIVAALSPDG